MTPLFRKLLGINWILLLAMFGILFFGVHTIESAARHLNNGGKWFADRQLMWIMFGAVVYITTSLIDYRLFKFLGIPMYLAGIGLMVAALKFGNEVHQLKFGGVSFQPAQFMVVAGILLLSFLIQDLPRWHQIFKIPLVKVTCILILGLIPLGLVAIAGDMGSALMWIPIIGAIMLVGGVPFRYLTFFVLLGIALIPPVFYVAMPKVSERGAGRIELYVDRLQGHDIDKQGAGWAIHYVTMAVGKAGYLGVGHNAGEDKGSIHGGKYIPWKTAHNDFIFAVIGEEQGFRGSMLLVTAFALLVIQCIYIAYYSRDLTGQILVSAVAALFAAHVFQNIGMCIEILPITGIPLPLVSYSGTFVMMCMFMLGLVQSVWIHRNVVPPELAEKPVRMSVRD